MLDPIVRVQAGRLRRSLERYYLLTGDTETIQIRLPKGGYVPVFETGTPGDRGGDASASRSATVTRAVDWPVVLVHPVEFFSPHDAEIASRMNDELTMECADTVTCASCAGSTPMQSLKVSRRRRGSSFAADCAVKAARMTSVHGSWTERQGNRSGATSTRRVPGPVSGRASMMCARVIAGRVGAEHGVMARVLAGEFEARRPDATGNFNAIQGCYHFLFSHQVRQLIPAVEALQQLTAREPEIPGAWACLARLYLVNHSFELTPLQTPIEQAISYACQGVALSPRAPGCVPCWPLRCS